MCWTPSDYLVIGREYRVTLLWHQPILTRFGRFEGVDQRGDAVFRMATRSTWLAGPPRFVVDQNSRYLAEVLDE